SVEIGVGLVLLLAAPAMRSGEFTVGDLALFTTYIGWLTALPQVIGAVLYRLPRAAVAVERLGRLLAPHEGVDDLTRDTEVWFHRPPPAVAAAPALDRLEELRATGLSVRLGPGGRGL